jgi:hypothetical protein
MARHRSGNQSEMDLRPASQQTAVATLKQNWRNGAVSAASSDHALQQLAQQ